MKERTLILLKPGVLQRAITGRVIDRFESKGFKIAGMKLMRITTDLARKHYEEHAGKPFFDDLVSYITSDPVVAMVLEADDVISLTRKLVGATRVNEAQPGTIRGDFAGHTNINIVHASDSPESSAREIALFFSDNELQEYERILDSWI
jgi:nucleoside-diphosphate kinase